MNLHLLSFNNYYNRTIKPIGSLAEVEDYEVFMELNANFNPNDGITTTHIIGGSLPYAGNADYLVVENNNEIISRWFIIENQRTRQGQYKISLKRDSVNDFAEQVFAAPCFVEKGWVPNNDPAIFNNENMTFNQIKQSEVLLKDKTNMPWLVGYYAKGSQLQASLPLRDMKADIVVSGLENWEYNSYRTIPGRLVDNYTFSFYFKPIGLDTTQKVVQIFLDNVGPDQYYRWASVIESSGTEYHYSMELNSDKTAPNPITLEEMNNLIKQNADDLLRYVAPNISAQYPEHNIISNITTFDLIKNLAGKVIRDSNTDKYYRISVKVDSGSFTGEIGVRPALISDFGFTMYNKVFSKVDGITGTKPIKAGSGYDFMASSKDYQEVSISLEEIFFEKAEVSILPSTSGETANTPYNIFTIPYGEFISQITTNGDIELITQRKDLADRLVADLIDKHGGTGGELYDVQLLPYCPIDTIRTKLEVSGSKTIFDLSNLDPSAYGEITGEDQEIIGYFFNVISSGTTFTIDFRHDISNIKVSNETEFCRLISPNWNGTFEFSPAKNYGINGFTVDYELKPFQPYIHVAPIWNAAGLYKGKNGDPVGLICGGDFGLTMINDNWEAYERQNKNYQQIFDRQIQNLEVQNKYGHYQDIANALTGTISGGATGVGIGMMGGLGPAAVGVGAGAAALSAVGGIADIGINQALRNENMDYTKDLFGYQLGNIKALPDNLVKVNSFNPNNTIFPILEFYGATDTEIAALENKIIYNGMTIGRIGQLANFRNPTARNTYVKGQIILLEDLGEDSHMANDIAAEINKGVRI